MTTDELLEKMLVAMEKMIDAQDDMWEEEQNCNYKFMWKIKEERLVPAKEEFKRNLDEYIDRRIETYCNKFMITRHVVIGEDV